jgi:hypothetical protein
MSVRGVIHSVNGMCVKIKQPDYSHRLQFLLMWLLMMEDCT